mgnify:CR=1 FL=1
MRRFIYICMLLVLVAGCKNKNVYKDLLKEEEKLIKIIRKIDFGEARVVVTDGKPTRIEEIKKSIKL